MMFFVLKGINILKIEEMTSHRIVPGMILLLFIPKRIPLIIKSPTKRWYFHTLMYLLWMGLEVDGEKCDSLFF